MTCDLTFDYVFHPDDFVNELTRKGAMFSPCSFIVFDNDHKELSMLARESRSCRMIIAIGLGIGCCNLSICVNIVVDGKMVIYDYVQVQH